MLLKSSNGTHYVLLGIPADGDGEPLYLVGERTTADEADNLPFFLVLSTEDYAEAEATIKSLASGKVVSAKPRKSAPARAKGAPTKAPARRRIAK